MRVVSLAMVSAVLIGACGDDAADADACADISGNYSVTSRRAGGDCEQALDPKTPTTVTMQRDGDAWNIVIPGLEGGCPGELTPSTCRYVATCKKL